MGYRIRFPRIQENRLELVPSEVALEIEAVLERIAREARILAQRTGAAPARSFRESGFSVSYQVDHLNEVILVTDVQSPG
ncbi:MAG: hypothetical protein ACYC8T_12055 [Myxococcaceae bacterium]